MMVPFCEPIALLIRCRTIPIEKGTETLIDGAAVESANDRNEWSREASSASVVR